MSAPSSSVVSLKALLETGVHFGHQARKWNPKMKPYIFTKRNGIHIIDLQQTVVTVNEVYDLVRDSVARRGTILYVGTKRQAQETIASEAERVGMPYVNTRWLGGTLTNWKTIKQRIDTLKRLEAANAEGSFEELTKKERLLIERKIARLQLRLGGLRSMERLPSLMFVVDVRREQTAVKEANIMKIPVIALVDTNCDPDMIDFVIPSNDDAIRAIKLLTSVISDAVNEGVNMRKAYGSDVEVAEITDMGYAGAMDEGALDEAYLGESTLAKLREGDLEFEDDIFEEDEDQPKRRR
ncbi:MAG: 30S ribosomal protein S2 [Chloroflexota bacterium]|nr:30S ribosomal protein S2 [Chloroflexota bacterium]NOG64164.1 30S ribosomal protein S2 [Chloroflexota bacterium]GIK65780.1 MAG: 30S ribosomal protein S2 [Chloroflexota bacterium]